MSLNKEINEIIGAEKVGLIKKAIEKFKAAFNAPVITPAVPAPVALDKQMKTQDGAITVSIGGQAPAVNVPVMDVTSGAPTPLADGTYTLEDGSSITVAAGVITAFTPAAAPDMPADFKTQFAAQKMEFETMISLKLKAVNDQIAIQKKETAEQAQTIADLTEINKTVVSFMEQIMETPVPEPEKKKFDYEAFEKMSSLEKRRYQKSFE